MFIFCMQVVKIQPTAKCALLHFYLNRFDISLTTKLKCQFSVLVKINKVIC